NDVRRAARADVEWSSVVKMQSGLIADLEPRAISRHADEVCGVDDDDRTGWHRAGLDDRPATEAALADLIAVRKHAGAGGDGESRAVDLLRVHQPDRVTHVAERAGEQGARQLLDVAGERGKAAAGSRSQAGHAVEDAGGPDRRCRIGIEQNGV